MAKAQSPGTSPQSNNNQTVTKAGGGKSTQNSLLISEIKDGVVIMHDGSLRGVILGSAINFDLMSPQEQDSVEFSYQGFLNSLHFPIQIVIKSKKIDLDPYIETLQSKRNDQSNELLGILMDDYIANIKALVEEVNIMDKQFYIVVPYMPPLTQVKNTSLITKLQAAFQSTPQITVGEEDFKKYKTELAQRLQLVSTGLTQIGIRAIALTTQELIDLYYSSYNPDVALNEKLIDAAQLQTPVVIKGEGSAPRGPLPGAKF
jgi:type IV secretory pathway VirB4 component